LRTENRDSTPVVKDGILQIYGSNFINIVKERKWAPANETEKGLLLFFTQSDCPKCDWNEAYFEKLAMEEVFNSTFVFARMDIDKNSPTHDLHPFLYINNNDAEGEETAKKQML
jgi:thioredoxin-related protein